MILGERMIGGIFGAAYFVEDLPHLSWENAPIPQAGQEFVLALVWPVQKSDVTGDRLGQHPRRAGRA